MKNLNIKIREVFIPFLLVGITTIVLYGVFRWFFDIKLGILPIKEELLAIWLPMVVTIIMVTVFLRRRIRILNLRGKRDDGHFIYQFIITFAIAVPLWLSQNYMAKNAYGLQEVSSISEIANAKNEKYFKIQSFEVNNKLSVPYITSRASGRNNEKLDFELYVTCPFKYAPNIWYGIHYSKRVSNNATKEKINRAYKVFLNVSDKKFAAYDFKNVNYFEKLGHSDDRDGYINAIKENYPDKNLKEQIILIPINEAFEERNSTSFPWIFGVFGIGALVVFIMIAIPKIDEQAYERYKKKKPLKNDDLRDILTFLDPRGAYKGTALLIWANIIVFVIVTFAGLSIISPTPQELLEVGGVKRPNVLEGEYWRLFTSTFIHGGFAHLFLNLVGIGLTGICLERIMGTVKFVVVYAVCGLLASLASIYWYENTVSVGASGSIFGMYGVLFIFLIFKIIPKYQRGIYWTLLGLFGGISLFLGLFSGATDNAGHLGGLFSGFLIAGCMILFDKKGLKKSVTQNF